MTRIKILSALFAGIVFQSLAWCGQISGNVVTDTGTPVRGAQVIVNIRATDPTASSAASKVDSKAPVRPFSSVTQSGPDGSFTVVGLPAGTFLVCAQQLNGDLLPSCLWEATEPTLTVGASETVSTKLVLKTGVHVKVRIDDPTGARSASEGKISGASILVGARTPSGRVIPMSGQPNEKGHDYDLLVPQGVDVEVQVNSPFYAIKDSNGKSIDSQNGAKSTVRGGAAPGQNSLTFTIAGVR